MSSPDSVVTAALSEAKAWPFEEARRLIARLAKIKGGDEKTVIFETGYGPSGLPHIGTFGEVARTSMVRHAFELLTDGRRKTRLICFSDDMDGLRKVPSNVPNQELLHAALNKPLTAVPDPFGKFESFAHHNNAMLRDFLDRFGFDYEFMSATEAYKAGVFDETLLEMLKAYDKVMDIILPTLGPERRATYSPFLPVSPRTGRVLQVPMVERHPRKGTIVYVDPDTGEKIETKVTGGAVKCQWKADWAMRWTALGVDYEMAGKDLIDSVTLSSRICKALGGAPPEGFNYELFLDDKGEKISKSRGNGLTIDDWLKYASPESLSLFMYQKPKTAKRLYFDVIPRAVDEYLQLLAAYPRQDGKAKLDNAVWHVHSGNPPAAEVPLTFVLLLNLVAASNAGDKDVLWGFIRRHVKGVSPETHPLLDQLAGYAVRYYTDFVKPRKKYRLADAEETAALNALSNALKTASADATAEDLQGIIYDVGRAVPRYQDHNAKGATPERPGVSNAWFNTIYEVLLGEEKGPRFGSFVQLYGIKETRALIDKALSGELTKAA
ncbi:lysine--tRNA ligase [Hyphomicrobium sp. xq]|uniref:Lysine--tRNA ligase n=1 Tax=Hyphomicrobium album TaxID=2665159 RepID=A0A6I3KKG4_9HYPH|nr:lysine--tRNA ligase [Hyphomicrobium album]MTD95614.1 lysine--tRNA ligase [Hyphomicrobium album]